MQRTASDTIRPALPVTERNEPRRRNFLRDCRRQQTSRQQNMAQSPRNNALRYSGLLLMVARPGACCGVKVTRLLSHATIAAIMTASKIHNPYMSITKSECLMPRKVVARPLLAPLQRNGFMLSKQCSTISHRETKVTLVRQAFFRPTRMRFHIMAHAQGVLFAEINATSMFDARCRRASENDAERPAPISPFSLILGVTVVVSYGVQPIIANSWRCPSDAK